MSGMHARYGLAVVISAALSLTVFSEDTKTSDEKSPSDRNRLTITRNVVVATKSEKPITELPYMTWSQGEEEVLLEKQSRIFSESLKYVPGVLLQKTGNGMTSPYLRGFTSQRVALFADGVRMNNSFLREGPNQYWNQIDHFFYDETEALFGPAGVLYGSDAIGGTVLARSSDMVRGQAGAGTQWQGGKYIIRGASAERSISEHLQGTLAGDDAFNLKFGLTRQDFGDLRTGDSVDNHHSGYEQWAANLRLRLWLDQDSSFYFGFDHFDQDDVNRVHRTIYHEDFHGTSNKGNTGDLARLYDHDRQMFFGRYELRNGTGLFEEVDLGLSYQNFTENYNRIRNIGDYDKSFTRIETYGFNFRTRSGTGLGKLTWGLDHYHDEVNSSRVRGTTIYDQGLVADDARYDLTNAYLQLESQVTSRFDVITGVNYTYAEMEAGTVDGMAVTDVSDSNGITGTLSGNWQAVTGNFRLLYRAIEDQLNLFTGISQGFRAPNLSDSTRNDEFGGGTEAPTADLDAEKFTTYEAGFKGYGDWGYLAGAYYYTQIKDRIARMSTPVTKVNLDDGHVHGAELKLLYNITESWSARTAVTWQEGEEWTYYNRDTTSYKTDYPMSRMSPLAGSFYLRWQEPAKPYWIEAGIDYSEKQDRMTDSEQDRVNPNSGDNRFPSDGTPSYEVYNIRSGWAVSSSLDVALALENILDEEYRIHGSGINEPGRQVVMTVVYKF